MQSGFRLTKNINNPNFGSLGDNAVDLSYAYTGTDYGAKGNFSFAAGISNTASGER